MPEGYRHLTHEERCRIGALKESGLSDGAIAARLGRDRTSVWRELRRNAGDGGYSPGEAQERAEARRSAASSNPRKIRPTGGRMSRGFWRRAGARSRSRAGCVWRVAGRWAASGHPGV